MSNHIVLYQPLMPANTGNIARTCAATNTALHLIHPLGFLTSDKMLKRAGLDYWDKVEVKEHANLEAFMQEVGDGKLHLVTKFAPYNYAEVSYKVEEEHFFLFGSETTGLPISLMEDYKDQCIRIPMNDEHVRSLNLSNAANIVLFEALRQQGWPHMEVKHHYRDTEKSRELNW